MDIQEKQKICIKILEEIIHLRIIFLSTYTIYQKCNEILDCSWKSGVSDFINEGYFNLIRKKYYEIYRNNCITTSLIPLKLSSSSRIALPSSNNMMVFYDKRRSDWRYIADAQILCGIDRKRNKKDIAIDYEDNIDIIFELHDPTSEILKNKGASGTLLEELDFFALMYLLRYGKTKIIKNTIPPVSEELYLAACKLSNYSFRKSRNKKIEYSKSLNKETKNWLKKLVKKINQSEMEEAMKKVSPRTSLYENSEINQLENMYYEIVKSKSLENILPEEIVRCEYEKKDIINAFNLSINFDDAIISKNRNIYGYYNNDTSFRLGNSTGGLLKYYRNMIAPTFAEEILISYMLLMSTVEETSLLGIKTTIQEAKKEYLRYINSILIIRDSFGEQFIQAML